MKKTILFSVIGIAVGLTGGYLYYHFVGCQTGACPLQSNAYFMSAYGGLSGLLLTNLALSFIYKSKNKK